MVIFKALKDAADQGAYLCQSDFVASKESGVTDYIGLFACTAGIGTDTFCKE